MVVDEVAALGYMALSYCWGGPQPLVLNRATAKHLQQQGGVPVTELPQTLADAVQVAQAVGLSYLWVDALCIMQDSEDDKAGEIARMAQYYSGSVVTLCAASAKRCTDGFLGVREDDPSVYSLGPVVLQARTSSGRMGSVLVFGENSDEAEDRREPTTMRGWTLQDIQLDNQLNPYGRVRSGRLEMEVQTCNLALAITEAAAATSSGNVYGVFVAPDSPPKDAYKQTLLELFHTTLELLPDTLLRKDQVMAIHTLPD
ncbi:MAG: hypothetical protein STHCBS139747_005148 [Sporothrix thermara]